MKNLSVWMGRTTFVVAMGLAGTVWGEEPNPVPVDKPADESADELAALALYEKGVALEAAGEWAQAEVQFQESWRRQKRPRTAAHLGRVQVEQGKFVEGATNLELFFQEDTEVPLEAKNKARGPYDVAKKNVGTLKLTIEPFDAVVLIDGNEVDAKRRGWPHYVTPGSHAVEVKKEGFVTKVETWTLAAGTERKVEITLKPPSMMEVGDGQGRGVGPVKPRPMPKLVMGTWIAGGVLGVVAIGTGIGARQTYESMYEPMDSAKDAPTWRNPVGAEYEPQHEGKRSTLVGLSISTAVIGGLSLGALGVAAYRTWFRSNATTSAYLIPSRDGLSVVGVW